MLSKLLGKCKLNINSHFKYLWNNVVNDCYTLIINCHRMIEHHGILGYLSLIHSNKTVLIKTAVVCYM